MWSYNYTNELYHYGVKGMKWGVRNSQEVRSVNRAYNKELRGLKKDLKKQNSASIRRGVANAIFFGKSAGVMSTLNSRSDNRTEFNIKKRNLQEKYEPEFQKAKQAYEDRKYAKKRTKEILKESRKLTMELMKAVSKFAKKNKLIDKESQDDLDGLIEDRKTRKTKKEK